MNWPLNFNQPSSWMMDDDPQRTTNRAGSSSQQSLDSNHNAPGGGDGMHFFSFSPCVRSIVLLIFISKTIFNLFCFDEIIRL